MNSPFSRIALALQNDGNCNFCHAESGRGGRPLVLNNYRVNGRKETLVAGQYGVGDQIKFGVEEGGIKMSKYSLSADERANLVAAYDSFGFNFAYGLRLLQLCIFNARDVFGGRAGYEDFGDWLDDILGLVEEGFENLERAEYAGESHNDEPGQTDDPDWDPRPNASKVTASGLAALMRELAESLDSAFDDIPEASFELDLNNEEFDRLDAEVASVAERVREVGIEACAFLTGARFRSTESDGGGNQGSPQSVECMFGNAL